MCLVSLPYVSARPGVSMNMTCFVSDPLQERIWDTVSDVSEYKLKLTLNLPNYPDKVLRVELFPAPVEPITTIVFN